VTQVTCHRELCTTLLFISLTLYTLYRCRQPVYHGAETSCVFFLMYTLNPYLHNPSACISNATTRSLLQDQAEKTRLEHPNARTHERATHEHNTQTTNTRTLECTNTRTHEHTNTRTHEHANARTHECTNTQTHECTSTRTL